MKKAFTLIEIVIVTMIILVTTAFSVNYLAGTQAGQDFENNFSSLLELVRTARNNAVFEKAVEVELSDGGGGFNKVNFNPENYGIYIENDKPNKEFRVTYFADLETREVGNEVLGTLLSYDTEDVENGGDFVFSKLSFPSDKYDITIGKNGVKQDMNIPLEFLFAAKSNSFFYRNVSPSVSENLLIMFRESTGNRCKAIKINFISPNPEISQCIVLS